MARTFMDSYTEARQNRTGGMGFIGYLSLLFIGLKLGEVGTVAGWSWWWVLSPLLITYGIIAVLLAVYVLLLYLTR